MNSLSSRKSLKPTWKQLAVFAALAVFSLTGLASQAPAGLRLAANRVTVEQTVTKPSVQAPAFQNSFQSVHACPAVPACSRPGAMACLAPGECQAVFPVCPRAGSRIVSFLIQSCLTHQFSSDNPLLS